LTGLAISTPPEEMQGVDEFELNPLVLALQQKTFKKILTEIKSKGLYVCVPRIQAIHDAAVDAEFIRE
jgi:hypothetical protein